MRLMARLPTVATVLIAVHFAWTGSARAEHHATAHMSAAQLQKSALKCLPRCRPYGWPSYLLSFPLARTR
jgi:hypothetical protein